MINYNYTMSFKSDEELTIIIEELEKIRFKEFCLMLKKLREENE